MYCTIVLYCSLLFSIVFKTTSPLISSCFLLALRNISHSCLQSKQPFRAARLYFPLKSCGSMIVTHHFRHSLTFWRTFKLVRYEILSHILRTAFFLRFIAECQCLFHELIVEFSISPIRKGLQVVICAFGDQKSIVVAHISESSFSRPVQRRHTGLVSLWET